MDNMVLELEIIVNDMNKTLIHVGYCGDQMKLLKKSINEPF